LGVRLYKYLHNELMNKRNAYKIRQMPSLDQYFFDHEDNAHYAQLRAQLEQLMLQPSPSTLQKLLNLAQLENYPNNPQ
jgi:hypothetical protein